MKLQYSIGWYAILILVFSLAFKAHSQQATPSQASTEQLEAAKSLMGEGDRLRGDGDEGSLVKAIEKYDQGLALFKKLNNPAGIGYALFSLGLSYKALNRLNVALQTLQLALDQTRKLNDSENTARVLSNIGAIFEAIGDNNEARKSYLEAVEISNGSNYSGFILMSLAELESKSGQIQQALENFEKAKRIFQNSGNVNGTYVAMRRIADSQVKLNRFTEARSSFIGALKIAGDLQSQADQERIRLELCKLDAKEGLAKRSVECFDRELKLAGENHNTRIKFDLLFGKADAINSSEDPRRSLDVYKEIVDFSRQNKEPLNEAFAHYGMGVSLGILKRYEDALRSYGDALLILRTTNHRQLEIPILSNQASIYWSQNRLDKSVESFEQALRISRELHSELDEERALENLGLVYHSVDDYQKALLYLEPALTLARKFDDKERQARILLRIGEAYVGTKHYEKVLAKYLESATIAKQGGNRPGESEALANVGSFYLSVGQFDTAKEYFERSMKIAVDIKDDTAIADATLGLAEVQIKLGSAEQSQRHFETVLRYARKFKDPYYEASALIGLGKASRNLLQLDRSRDYLITALEVATRGEEKYRAAQAANELGDTYLELGQFKEALQFSERSLRESRLFSDEERIAFSIRTIMKARAGLNQPEIATFYGKLLINMAQNARKLLGAYGVAIQTSFLNDKAPFYRELSDILISQGRIAEAERVIAMLKEEELFEFVRRDGDIIDELLTAKLILTPEEQKAFEEYKKHSDTLASLGKEFGDLQIESRQYEVGKFPKQARLEELEKKISNANVVFSVFLDALKISFGAQDVRINTLESGSQSLLAELAEAGTVFVSTLSGETKLNIVVTTADIQKAYSVKVSSAELNKLVADFRSALRSPRIDPRSRGKALYDVLFPAGLIKDLEGVKANTIVWSLDGALRYIPISALWDGQGYLVERYNNVVITLASRDKISAPSPDRSKWQALGVGVSKQASLKEADGTVRNFEALTAVPEELCSVISDPAGKERCAAIDKDAKGVISGKTLLDEEFSFQTFKQSLGRFPVVHVASHFSLNAGNESDSYLLLGGGEDRRLSLATVRQGGAKFTGVDLLTLSACNTGMTAGSKSNGLEIEGFGALAQRSGAKSVLASLWAVSDTSTRDLMIEFYLRLEQNPKLWKVEALRRAQITLLNGKYKTGEIPAWRSASGSIFIRDPSAPYAHPYYWSPFILIGNWH